jgi:hypothetical protein
MFQLNQGEKEVVVASCDHLNNIKFTPNLDYLVGYLVDSASVKQNHFVWAN